MRSLSSWPSHWATTSVATQLPSRFTETRIESMMRSAPSSSATAATGMAPWPMAATVAESARNDEPGTPAMPFEVNISTSTAVICSPRVRLTPRAWARKSTQIDRYKVAPSRLKEYPVGMTSPVVVLEHPAWLSLVMMRGNTTSVEAVPRARNNSSLM
ncbi:Uncharacterised protein [Mycobacteroides abscessus subsp. abscessus]|nr:Uncharacterised protein [Mycobacteroides abscessus subsp. abscessus]